MMRMDEIRWFQGWVIASKRFGIVHTRRRFRNAIATRKPLAQEAKRLWSVARVLGVV